MIALEKLKSIKRIKNKRNIIKNSAEFCVGGLGYGAIEIAWRGYTHWSMLFAGGISFVFFSHIAENFKSHPMYVKAAIGALGVTAVELAFGIVFNIILKENVWDYSSLPLNFMGQICPLYSILWGFLGYIFIPLADFINKLL